MNGDERFEVAVALYKIHNVSHFDLRVGIRAVVDVSTGVIAGSRPWEKCEQNCHLAVH